MKRTVNYGFILLLLQFSVLLKVNAMNETAYEGTITIYVGEETTVYHSVPYQYYVNPDSWYLSGPGTLSKSQERLGVKIVSKDYYSCTIKGISENESVSSIDWCELHCKGTKNSTGEYYDCYWKVIVKLVHVTSITLNKSSLSLQAGQSETLTATVLPNNATNKNVTWTSSNTSVATVDSNGKVTAVAVGSATITCRANDGSGVQATCAVTVTDPNVLVTSITLNKSSLSLQTGQSETLTATVLPSNATNKTVTWTSSNTSIATVDANGKVTAVAAGTATITCKANDGSGKQTTCAVTVTAPGPVVESISLWWSTTVHLDGTKTLTPTITPSNATPTLTWTSSDTSVATVDQNGKVTGKKIGSATIRVYTDNGKSDYCIVKVVKVFTAQTVEGKTMTFQILSEDDKTCQAGEDYTVKTLGSYQVTTWAVPYGTTGQVTIPGTAGGYTVTGIGGLGFLNLRNITSVSIPNTVKDIGYAAFEGCTGIETMTIPNSVTDIQSCAFWGCTKLKAVTLPNSVGRLRDYLFCGDVALTAIDIPSSVTEIGWRTFDGTGLNEITIPSSVTKIESYAFANCTSMEKVTSMIAEPFEIDKNVFENTTDDVTSFTTATLYVPKGTKSVYQNTSAWNEFGSIIELGGGPNPEPDEYTDISQYSNIVYLEPATASPESTLTLPVKMKNPQTNISGFQFDLVLPTGVTVAKDEDDFYLIELSTDRTTVRKHMVSAQQQADGSIRVVCYSNSNSTFSGTSGNVLTMTLLVAADAPTGETSIKLRDVVMTTPALDSYNVPWVVSKLTIEDYIPGDVNGDKLVNVVDVAGVVNLILNSGNTAQLNRKAADINGDGNVNVVDVAGIVNIILGGGANARMAAPLAAAGQSRLYIENFSMEPGETKTVSVNLSNPGDSFTGCQFDLYLPDGLTVAEEDGFPLIDIGSRTTARKHTVSATVQADGSLRVVCYSNNNHTFSGEDGEILTITFKAADNAPAGKKSVWMRNITLSRPDVTGVSPEDVSTEVTITGDEHPADGIVSISAGFFDSWAINGNGELWTWGGNKSSMPKLMMNGVSAVSAGSYHTMIVKNDGTLWACGENDSWQLVDESIDYTTTPIQVLSNVAAVSAGGGHTMIIKNDGSLWACGWNEYGQLGDGTTAYFSALKKVMSGVASVSAGFAHTMTVKTDGTLWACGYNNHGQLGDGTTTDVSTPKQVMTGVASVSAGHYHTMIVKADGTLWACGENKDGQLGDDTTTDVSTPKPVMTGVASVSSGGSHTMILKTDGTLWACGSNSFGQLGDGTTASRNTPKQIMTGVAAVAAGENYTLILKTDGKLWACGRNYAGQLGDGTTVDRLAPVLVRFGEESAIPVITSESNSRQPVYSLSGQRLAAPRKGVNIVGVRKVVVK